MSVVWRYHNKFSVSKSIIQIGHDRVVPSYSMYYFYGHFLFCFFSDHDNVRLYERLRGGRGG